AVRTCCICAYQTRSSIELHFRNRAAARCISADRNTCWRSKCLAVNRTGYIHHRPDGAEEQTTHHRIWASGLSHSDPHMATEAPDQILTIAKRTHTPAVKHSIVRRIQDVNGLSTRSVVPVQAIKCNLMPIPVC